MNETPYFEMTNITKLFARVVANRNVNIKIHRGEVLALLGENGAGKSTLMKILYGLYKSDEGQIFKDGEKIKINSPKDAMDLGISMIQQHFSLIPAHTVLDNIILGNVHGRIDYKEYAEKVHKIVDKYNMDIDIYAKVRDLDIGEQQKVEILKSLFLDTNLLIMDEPTAVLTPQEIDNLMDFVSNFAEQGNAVIFITHKMKEVMKVADRIAVMRDGEVVKELLCEEATQALLSQLMIGHQLVEVKSGTRDVEEETETGLRVVNLNYSKNNIIILDNISFNVGKGEVLGIAGVSGNGQQELCEALYGSITIDSGSIRLNDVEISKLSTRYRIKAGVGYVPVNRHDDAMIADMNLAENVLLRSSYEKTLLSGPFIRDKILKSYTDSIIDEFKIKTPGLDEKIGHLSGGNQQKMIVGREVRIGKSLLILNQPTRGLDIGAVNNIHSIIIDQCMQGKSIVMVSTELTEIFALSHRIAVMYKGKIMGIYRPDELTTEKIGLLMAGYTGEEVSAYEKQY